MRIANTEGRLESIKRSRLGAANASEAKIDAVAKDFEAQFISSMMENMFSTVEVSEEFGGGHAEEIYRSMIINEYGKLMARAGGIGVADHVKREMIRMQEVGGGNE